jgi:hypothetical protein
MPVTFKSAEAARASLFDPPLADKPSAKRLANHRTVSATAIDGWSSALFGVPFATAGIFMALVALNRIHPQKHAPDWVIGIIAGMFFFGGVFFVVHGICGVIDNAAWRREAAVHPNQPWLYDYRWRREGIAFSAFDDMVKRLLAAIVWTTFLLPFAWVGLTQRGAWPFLAAVGIFGLLGLIFWYRWAQMLFDFLRYGNSFLTYNEFPFALGGVLRARLRVANHVSAIDELILTFRCVEEKYVTVNTGRDRETRVVCYELYAESATFDRDRLNGLLAGEIPVEFRIPPDQPGTTLVATPPTYWEIEAKGKASGADYQAYFMVPVYKIS